MDAMITDVGTTRLIFGVVLGTILCDYALTLLSTLLNYRALDQPLPAEFDGVYDRAAYAQSQRYTKAKSVHALLHGSYDLAVLMLFWLAFDGFERLDLAIRATLPGEAPELEVGRGLLYMGTLMFAEGVLGLPWGIYFTFVLEEHFGFNKTTAKTFACDMLKGLMLTLLVGAPLGGALLAFFVFAGSTAWLYAWLFLALAQVLLMYVAPVWIFPLFNTFEPLAEGELKQAIDAYAAGVSFRYQIRAHRAARPALL